jgi:hypothetical protein
MTASGVGQGIFEVELPGGIGKLHVRSVEEVEIWDNSMERYKEDYQLTKQNDLVLLGVILQNQLIVYREQTAMNGMKQEVDASGIPTGNWQLVDVDGDEMAAHMTVLNKAAAEITRVEKVLGIDKATRESGGAYTVENYLRTLKRAGHARGIHISKRALAYEEFANQLRWRLRGLKNWDAEDRAYHKLTPETVLDWCREELSALEEIDKKFAREVGKLYIGKL